jgi:hypothetical protein
MTDLGDPYPLSVSITDENDNLANAGQVNLTITLPDGTLFDAGIINPVSTGVYEYRYATIQVGRHNARWLATGGNDSSFNTGFYVNPTDTGEFISLAQLRNHIKKSHNRDDESLRTFIAASCQVISDRVGQVAPMTFTEDVEVFDGYARLRRYPLISVASVQTLPGLTTVPQGDRATGAIGWYFNVETDAYIPLLINRNGWHRITYRAGRLDIPQNYILAALELAKHLWQESQQNPGGGRPPVGTDDVIVNGVTYAFPYNVRQLLGLDKRPRKEVLVG